MGSVHLNKNNLLNITLKIYLEDDTQELEMDQLRKTMASYSPGGVVSLGSQ